MAAIRTAIIGEDNVVINVAEFPIEWKKFIPTATAGPGWSYDPATNEFYPPPPPPEEEDVVEETTSEDDLGLDTE